jgi:hypothetical protein
MNELIQVLGSVPALWIAALLYGFIMGGFCHKLADEKGYEGGFWFFTGFFLGIFALIAAAGLPDKKLRSDLNLFLLRETSRSEATFKSSQSANVFSVSPHLKGR